MGRFFAISGMVFFDAEPPKTGYETTFIKVLYESPEIRVLTDFLKDCRRTFINEFFEYTSTAVFRVFAIVYRPPIIR